jgi:hypothetical protein
MRRRTVRHPLQTAIVTAFQAPREGRSAGHDEGRRDVGDPGVAAVIEELL